VIEIERVSRFEEQGVLTAFRSEPETIFAAKHVHVWLSFARGNRLPPDPTKAGRVATARRARHDAPLVGRRHRDPRLTGWVVQQDELRVLPEKRHVGRERRGWRWCDGLVDRLARCDTEADRQTRCGRQPAEDRHEQVRRSGGALLKTQLLIF
jgi:hypothetical protein